MHCHIFDKYEVTYEAGRQWRNCVHPPHPVHGQHASFFKLLWRAPIMYKGSLASSALQFHDSALLYTDQLYISTMIGVPWPFVTLVTGIPDSGRSLLTTRQEDPTKASSLKRLRSSPPDHTGVISIPPRGCITLYLFHVLQFIMDITDSEIVYVLFLSFSQNMT